jgi:2-iminobutanoate/2-iminopropanoate deaminase
MKKAISCDAAPAAIGPYSQAVVSGGQVYVSGQLGLNPASGQLAGPGVAEQARQALENLQNILTCAGAAMAEVVKTTIFLTDMADFAAVNAVYAEFFVEPFPARACVAVKALPKNALVEIEAIAALG